MNPKLKLERAPTIKLVLSFPFGVLVSKFVDDTLEASVVLLWCQHGPTTMWYILGQRSSKPCIKWCSMISLLFGTQMEN